MKSVKSIFCFVVLAMFLADPASLWGQEKKELLSEKHPWSFTATKPGKNWTTQYPLPKAQICIGELHTDKQWPKNKPYAWMTAKVTLPANYVPQNLYLRYSYNENAMIFVNGELVHFGTGHTRCWLGRETFTKRLAVRLTPGDNIIAAYCEKIKEKGFIGLTLLADDAPPLDIVPLLAPMSKWSYTLEDPGDQWVAKFPLPRSSVGIQPFSSENIWPGEKKNIWMTHAVTLPRDYVPGELVVQHKCDSDIWLYINGKLILQTDTRENWQWNRDVNNPLKPGKNIIAVRCFDDGYPAFIGVEFFLRNLTKEDKANPLAHLQRDPAAAPEPEVELTEMQKQIVRALAAFKMGQEKLGIATLENAAKEDEKDWVANNVLGVYYLLKTKKRPDAFKCFQKCVKANSKDPAVLNNYGVAAVENKKYEAALQSWERLAKQKNPPYQLAQNVAMVMELVNRKRIMLKDAEQTRLLDLYIKVCAGNDIERDVNLGFLLVPPADDLNADAVFTQEMKRGRETMQGQPFELKWHSFAK